MNRSYSFNRQAKLPIVTAILRGKNKIEMQVRLIFDTGAACSQFNTAIIDDLGYSAAVDGLAVVSAYGPAGPLQTGYTFQLEQFEVLGRAFRQPIVAAYDFDNFADSRIVGLLGYDLIKEFHLEMNGPSGELLIFDE